MLTFIQMIMWDHDLNEKFWGMLSQKYIDSFRIPCGEIECSMHDKNLEKQSSNFLLGHKLSEPQ